MAERGELAEESFLTVAEVADLLKLNQQTVRNWIDQGSLRALRVGRRVRIKRSDLERMLEEGYRAGPATATEPAGPSAEDFWGGEAVGIAEPADLAEAAGQEVADQPDEREPMSADEAARHEDYRGWPNDPNVDAAPKPVSADEAAHRDDYCRWPDDPHADDARGGWWGRVSFSDDLDRQRANVMRAVRKAGAGWAQAMRAHKLAPPDAGFAQRLKALSEAAADEQVAWEHAHAAGLLWRPVPGAENAEPPYELRPGTGRRGPADLWARFDAGVTTLNRAITGSDAAAVADAFGEMAAAAGGLAEAVAAQDAAARDAAAGAAAVDESAARTRGAA